MKKLSKKMLALLLSVLMVLTVIPMGAFLVTADEPQDNYLFAYFTGNSTEQQRIKFALSEDGKQYYAINKNDPVIKQNLGTGCARDPYVFRGQDGKFYAIATDMNAAGGWWGNSNSFVLWRSNDLITWTDETIIDVSAITGVDVYRAWAPQVTWDATANKYMIYFGLAANGYSAGGTKMHYMYTTDLLDQSKYETPQPMMTNNAVANNDSIDGDITYYNGTYYMFYKDESQGGICIVTSSTINGLYNTDNIVKLEAGSSIGALEGCQVWWDADTSQYVLMADRYSANGVFACYNIGADLDTFYAAVSANNDISGYYNSTMSNSISVLGPRHGSILNITATEYNALKNAYGIASNEDIRYNFNSQDYAAENSWHYDAIQDTSGYSYDVMTNSGQYSYTYTDEHYISLNGSTVFVNDPAVKALLHEAPWTVSFDVSVAETRNAPVFALTSGDSPAASIDWIRLLDNGDAYLYKNGAYTKIGSAPTTLSSVEYTYTIVYNGTSIYFYRDGVLFASDEIGTLGYDNTKATNYAAFGWTDTCGVTGVHGAFTNVRFRNKAISSSQVASETAIGSELLYRYNEGTTEINGRINATAGGTSGVTTSMSGARGASYTIAGWFNIGASKEGSLFSLGWGGTGDDKQYLNLREDGVINYCWNEGATDHYFDSASIYNFAANTWYYVQINIVPDNNSAHFRAFVNGTSVMDQTTGYIRMTTHAYNPHAFFLQNAIDVRLGTSGVGWWNATSNTNFDDFRVYTKAIDPTVLYQKQLAEDRAEAAGESGAETGANIDEAIAIYESRIAKMANSGYSMMYTNLSAAYEAYKVAIRDKGTIGEADALAGLNEALTNMQPFVERTGTFDPGEGDVNYNPTSDYFGNIIYAEGGNNEGTNKFDDDISAEIYEKHGIAARYGSWAYLYYPATVLLYDGKNTPKIPVVVGFRNNDNRYAVEVLQVGTDMSDFGLNEYWTGYDNSTAFKWPEANNNQFRSDDLYAEAKGNGMWTPSDGNTTSYYLVKNSLSYTAVPTSAYTCYSSTVWNIRSAYTYINDHYINDTITNAVPDIDVINYKKLIDALSAAANNSTNKGYLGDLVEKYQHNGLEGIFAAFDSATSLDPMTGSTYFKHTYAYDASGEEAMDQAALLCGNDIDASVKLLGDIKITTENANYERLCQAITAYEQKMYDMTSPFTNLEAAYNAYILAVEYKDAYEFGGRETFENPTLAIAAQNLEEATANMKSLNEVTWSGKAFFNGSISNANAQPAGAGDNVGFNNILYCSETTRWTNERDWNGAYYRYGMPSVSVIIYDGIQDPSLPVGFSFRRKNNQKIYYCRMYNGPFEFRNHWRGYNNYNTAYHYNSSGYDVGTNGAGIEENYEYASSSYSNYEHNNSGTGRQYVNKMFYNGNGADSTDITQLTHYYQTINNIQFAMATTRNSNPNNAWVNDNSNNAEKLGTVYVINYKALKDKVDALAFSHIDVTQYREGGLKTDANDFKAWLKKIDTITQVNPNDYFVNMNDGQVPGKVTECATAIKNACDAANSISTTPPAAQNTNTHGDIYEQDGETLKPISQSNGAYTNLKIAILEAAQKTEQGCIVNVAWSAYQSALIDAKAGMADIANANSANYTDKQGYNSTAYSAADINTLATNLHDAIQALSDPSNTSHPLKFSYREIGTHAMWFQCHNNNAHEVYHHDNTAETVVPAEGSVYDTMQIVYKTLDKTKYNNFSTIEAGKIVFDEVKTAAHPTTGMMSLGETAKAQRIVDDGVATLLEAINTANDAEGIEENPSVPLTYDVTFQVYEVDNTGEVINTLRNDTQSYGYGNVQTFDVSEYTGTDKEVQYWIVGGHRVNSHETTINVNSQRDITVEAYIKAVSADTKLIIKSTSNKDFCTINVSADDTIAIKSGDVNTIIINGNERRVPDSLTYQITGWHINYKPEVVTELAEGTTVGDLLGTATELVLKPEKLWKYGSKDTVYPFTVDGVAVADGAVPYDYHLRVNAGTADSVSANWTYGGVVYGIAFFNSDNDIFVPVTYGNTYRFWVNRDMDFYTIIKADGTTGIDAGYYLPAVNTSSEQDGYQPFKIADEETMFYLDGKLPMVYSYAEPTGAASNPANRWTTRSAFTAAVGGGSFGAVTITECGTLYTANSAYSSEQNLVIENAGTAAGKDIFQKVNNNRDADSNQYSWSTTNPTDTAQMLYTRAYVKYSYTYRNTTIDAIAYGPVNVCEFSASAQ